MSTIHDETGLTPDEMLAVFNVMRAALQEIALTSRGYPNGSREGCIADEALTRLDLQ